MQNCGLERNENSAEGPKPYSGLDAPLSLRYDTRSLREVLKDSLGVGETGAAIALDVYAESQTSGRWSAYSRSKRHYAALKRLKRPKWQLRDSLYRMDHIIDAVEHLDGDGWIDHEKASPGDLGWQSRIRAKSTLVDTMRNLTAERRIDFIPARPSFPIMLRDADGETMELPDDVRTRRMSRNVEMLNEGFRGLRLEGAFPACVMRIHNESLERGGRFYLEGGSVQIIPEEQRLRVTFGGEKASEVDYKTMHISMLYGDAGLAPPSDAYAIEGWPRDLVKVAVLAVINAPTFSKALGAVAFDKEMAVMAIPGTDRSFALAASLIAALKLFHVPIARFFHTGVGAYLMRRESDILEDVMLTMLRKGESVLPVHDSAICRTSMVGHLEEAMMAAAERAGLRRVRLETTHAANV